MRPLPTAALALLMIAAAQPVVADPAGGRRTWELSAFSWVKRQPAEKGAPANGQPLRVDAAVLAQALGSLRFVSGSADEPLFAASEAAGLAKALEEALALAEPGEDLELVSTSKRDAGLLSTSLAVTARVFAQDGKLNVIVHDTRLDFLTAYYAEFRAPTFEFGSRTKASAVALKAAGAELRRGDWAVLPLAAPAAVTKTQPVAAPPAAPASSLEDRLRALKRLREQGLISEEEYARKKQDLLKEF